MFRCPHSCTCIGNGKTPGDTVHRAFAHPSSRDRHARAAHLHPWCSAVCKAHAHPRAHEQAVEDAQAAVQNDGQLPAPRGIHVSELVAMQNEKHEPREDPVDQLLFMMGGGSRCSHEEEEAPAASVQQHVSTVDQPNSNACASCDGSGVAPLARPLTAAVKKSKIRYLREQIAALKELRAGNAKWVKKYKLYIERLGQQPYASSGGGKQKHEHSGGLHEGCSLRDIQRVKDMLRRLKQRPVVDADQADEAKIAAMSAADIAAAELSDGSFDCSAASDSESESELSNVHNEHNELLTRTPEEAVARLLSNNSEPRREESMPRFGCAFLIERVQEQTESTLGTQPR